MNLGRNDLCACGSGKKYKKCCLGKAESRASLPHYEQRSGVFAPHGAAKRIDPSPAELSSLAGLFNAGRLAELESLAHSLLERHPESGFVWKVLGAALLVQGRDSLPTLQKASKLLPDDADTHYNMGNALMAQGMLTDAEASYRRALQIRPDDADVHFNLGNVLLSLGNMAEAEASYRRALQAKPDFAEVHGNLGNLLRELGRMDEAEASYLHAIQSNPGYATAYFNLGNLLHELGRLAEAEASYRLALRAKPDSADTYANLGNTLLDMDRLEEAETSFRQSLRLKPDHVEAQYNLGKTLLELGRSDEAETSFRHALRIRPDHVRARVSLAFVRKVKADDENLAALVAAEKAMQGNTTPLMDKDAVFLYFALGKCYDDIGDYAKAFPYFLEGARLKRTTFAYDPDETTRHFASIMHNFDTAMIAGLHGGGDPSHLPIFVLGMPRSGTTLTEQIIASHPEVYGAGELPDLRTIAERDIAGTAFPDNTHLLNREQLTAWGAEYVAGLRRRAPNARYITDKMPANFLDIGLIHLMLPNAKIIHVSRNPVDTCLSCFTTLFEHGQEHTYDLTELGRYYVDYAHLMEHWRKVLPSGAFLDVQYESIVADQEAQARRILEYCGIEWNDACLDFHRNKRAIRTASMTQVRQPIYKSSVERWRPYEKFLGPLFDALGELAPTR